MNSLSRKVIFWVSASIVWIFFSVAIQNKIDELVVYVVSWFKKSPPPYAWLALVEVAVMSAIGVIATYFSRDVIKKCVKEGQLEHVEEIGREAQDQAYFAYLTIVRHTQEMKNLVNQVIRLPKHPQVLQVLIDDYSKKAKNSRFLVDFPTFLKLAGIFVKNSKRMFLVNTTPPYEWSHPIRYERNREIEEAISNYKEKIESKIVQRGFKGLSRITVLENDTALFSILEHGIHKYFSNLGIEVRSYNLLRDEDIASPIVAWIQNILRKHRGICRCGTLEPMFDIIESGESHLKRLTVLLSKYMSADTFSEEFQDLSRQISMLILQEFVKLHKPPESAFYILKNKVSIDKKDEINKLGKEEGIFEDSTGTTYLLRIEEQNGANVLLATVKTIQRIDTEHYVRLKTEFVDDLTEHDAIGNFASIVKCQRD